MLSPKKGRPSEAQRPLDGRIANQLVEARGINSLASESSSPTGRDGLWNSQTVSLPTGESRTKWKDEVKGKEGADEEPQGSRGRGGRDKGQEAAEAKEKNC